MPSAATAAGCPKSHAVPRPTWQGAAILIYKNLSNIGDIKRS